MSLYDRIFRPRRYTLSDGTVVEEKRSRAPLVILILVLLTVVSVRITGFNFSVLVKKGSKFFDILKAMFPPNTAYLGKIWQPLWDTIKMSFLGSFIGAVLAIPFAIAAASNIVTNRVVVFLVRLFLSLVRTLPTLVCALIATYIFGLGTMAGTCAIAVFTFAYVGKQLFEIIETVENGKTADFKMVFDPTLVRGMSYYTGTIFEIAMPQFGGSCGGGGRYDKMVGKFTGNDVPACGFSIGFERIILLLMENGFKVPKEGKKIAYLMEKGLPSGRLCEVMKQAQEERQKGNQILVARMNKNKKFQKEQLTAQGYEEFQEFYREELKR